MRRGGHLVITLREPTARGMLRRLARLPGAADLVELRLDALRRPEPERLIPRAAVPVIATCRPIESGGGWSGGAEERLALLHRAAAAGAAFIDVEADSSLAGAVFGGARRIISQHLDHTPAVAELMAQAAALAQKGELIKLIPLARSSADLATTLSWMKQMRAARRRWIGFAAGAAGAPSRTLAPALGSWATYAAAPGAAPAAAGQPAWDRIAELTSIDQLRAARRFFGIAGRPVAHSLSPRIHNHLLRRHGLPALYLALEVDSAAALDAIVRSLPFSGLSVTVPLKEEVIAYLDRLTPRAAHAGAVNTILRRGRKWIGDNTDAGAIAAAVARRRAIAGRRVLVLGAGGSGRAAVSAMTAAGAEVVVCNRTAGRARMLADRFGCSWCPWPKRERVAVEVVINTTTLGLIGKRLPLSLPRALRGRLVVDLVYLPQRETDFVKHARRYGAAVVSGREILLRQAAEQFGLFTGRRVRWSALRALVDLRRSK